MIYGQRCRVFSRNSSANTRFGARSSWTRSTILIYVGQGSALCDSAELGHPSFPLLLRFCFLIFWFTPPISFLLQALAPCPLPSACPWSEPLPSCSHVPPVPILWRNRLQRTASSVWGDLWGSPWQPFLYLHYPAHRATRRAFSDGFSRRSSAASPGEAGTKPFINNNCWGRIWPVTSAQEGAPALQYFLSPTGFTASKQSTRPSRKGSSWPCSLGDAGINANCQVILQMILLSLALQMLLRLRAVPRLCLSLQEQPWP